VVLDELLAEDVIRRVDRLSEGGEGIGWVISCRDPERARQLMALSRGQHALRNLRFLPMNVPMEAWRPMFRLVLCGNFFLPWDLFSADVVPVRPPPRPGSPSDRMRRTEEDRKAELPLMAPTGGPRFFSSCAGHSFAALQDYLTASNHLR